MPARTGSRFLAIDILRAIAVLAVVTTHIPTPESMPPAVKAGLAPLMRGGWIGVNLFFVLSGFLVSSLLFAEYARYGAIRPGRFLVRRGLKIYPAFYAMLGLTIVYHFRGWWLISAKRILAEAFFVQNYFYRIWGHTWTLAIEEHFYLLLTVGLFLLARRGRRSNLSGRAAFKPLVSIFFVTACFCLIARSLTFWYATKTGRPGNFSATHFRIDELFFGVLLSYLWAFNGEELRKKVGRYRLPLTLAVASMVPLSFLTWTTGITYTIGFVFLYVTFGALLLLMLQREIQPSLGTELMRRVGVASYSIYLWHIPWRLAVEHISQRMHLPDSAWPVPLLLYFFGSIIVGIVGAALIELPVLRIRDRLFPSRSGTPASLLSTIALPPRDNAPPTPTPATAIHAG
jgi:peptidoglycan/LPS O-acetylase OafA/YrhL